MSMFFQVYAERRTRRYRIIFYMQIISNRMFIIPFIYFQRFFFLLLFGRILHTHTHTHRHIHTNKQHDVYKCMTLKTKKNEILLILYNIVL